MSGDVFEVSDPTCIVIFTLERVDIDLWYRKNIVDGHGDVSGEEFDTLVHSQNDEKAFTTSRKMKAKLLSAQGGRGHNVRVLDAGTIFTIMRGFTMK